MDIALWYGCVGQNPPEARFFIMNPILLPVKLYGLHCAWPKRRRTLAAALAPLLSEARTVLDVGCGDGLLARDLAARRPGLRVHGVDVRVPGNGPWPVPICRIDGRRLPFPDGAYDVCLLVDVLHHCLWPLDLLREAARVARRCVIVQDHDYRNRLELRLMQLTDHLILLTLETDVPVRHKTWEEFTGLFRAAGLRVARHEDRLRPGGMRDLLHHFIVELRPVETAAR